MSTIVAGALITSAANRAGSLATKAEMHNRTLVKKQEGLLNELASNLPVVSAAIACQYPFHSISCDQYMTRLWLRNMQWKLYGWCEMFVGKLNENTKLLELGGRQQARWAAIGSILATSSGNLSVLVSVGVNSLLGGPVELVALLTASSYVALLSKSMNAIMSAKQDWQVVAAECKVRNSVFPPFS